MAGLRELQARHEAIGDVRGMGLLCGLELVEDRDTRGRRRARHGPDRGVPARGLSINLVRGGTGGTANCIRMAPPLTIGDDEIDLALTILDEALTTVTSELSVS